MRKLLFWTRKVSPYQLQGRELINRARKLNLPDAKLYGEPGGLGEIFDSQYPVEGLRHQIVEQERWNRDQKLWLVALFSAIASAISALAAWAAILYGKQG
jgi:hypothetical protein